MEDLKLTIGIPTKDRPVELARLLAALHAQTFQNWDLVIVDDSVESMLDAAGEFWLEALKHGHRIKIVEGVMINQCYSHNRVLWSPNTERLILRMDDDHIPNRDFIEQLVRAWHELAQAGEPMGAVAGIYFDDRQPRAKIPPIPTELHYSTQVGRSGNAFAIAQMVEYSDQEPFDAEHIYSSCLYSRDAMRQVGGWPLVYSDDVAHREETDGTYKLHLAGYKLFVVPSALCKHEHGTSGGIRSISPSEHRLRRDADDKLWRRRVNGLRGVNYRPSIAVCSYHVNGIGGAQRLFYSLVSSLQTVEYFERVVPIALPAGAKLQSAECIKSNFGLEIDLHESELDWTHEEFDVVICVGHEPARADELPPRRHHIHYNLYPTIEFGLPRHVKKFVSISEFSAGALNLTYRRRPEVIYPFVRQTPLDAPIEKENIILVVGDVSRGKNLTELVQFFMSTRTFYPPNTVLHIITPSLPDSEDASHYLRRAAESPHIELHCGVDQQELTALYRRAKVLWAGRGYGLPAGAAPIYFEHFGYTPVEAMAEFCIPLGFNGGGYRETCPLTWDDMNELMEMTRQLMSSPEQANTILEACLVEFLPQFSYSTFITNWVRIITSLNTFAWEVSRNELRVSRRGLDVVGDGAVHIGCISESPYRHTGFRVISEQVYQGLLDAGFRLHVFAVNDHRPDLDKRYHTYWPTNREEHDITAILKDFIGFHPYDAMFVSRDPVGVSQFIKGIRAENPVVPIVAMVSQEGLPLHSRWRDIVQGADRIITYASCTSLAVKERYGIEPAWVHLGADHANFRPLPPEERQILRSKFGWHQKYVILNVARNARNKRQPAILKTIKILRDEYGYDDLLTLLHCDPHGRAIRHAQDLPSWIISLGLEKEVIFTPIMDLRFDADFEELLVRPVSTADRERTELFRDLGMVGLYNIADLLIDTSSAEGFCLPNVEAMACGLPVVSVNDEYVRTEVLKDAALLVQPSDTVDEWINGADLKLVDPKRVAEMIDALRDSPSVRQSMVVPGLELVQDLKWDYVREVVVEAVKSCLRK